MSEHDNQGAQTGASPAQQQTIPYERFQEVLSQRRQLEEQNNTLQHMVRTLAPQPNAQPQQLPEFLNRLKEENPGAFQAFMAQQERLQNVEANLFTSNDNQDRLAFLTHFGELGKSRIEEVENKLESLRRQGQHGWTRGLLLKHMLGDEALAKQTRPQNNQAPSTPAPAQATAATQGNPTQGFVPSNDPSAAATTTGRTAPVSNSEETLEEMEARLANIEL